MRYEAHPAAKVFPLMEGEAYESLVADIKANGLRHPIVLIKGEGTWLILDGRNRDRACVDSGVKPKYDYYDGNDPVGYAVSANLSRRHLNESQRSLVAKRLADLEWGGNRSKMQICSLTQEKAAELLNVSERSVANAGQVIKRGVPELVEAVEKGEVAVSRAAEIAKLAKEQQAEALQEAKTQPRKAPTPIEVRDRMTTREVMLTETDISALKAMCRAALEMGDPRAAQGVRVLARILPAMGDS